MNPNIADLGKERPSVLHDDQGGMYPVILSTRQIDIDPNERYLYDCPNCYAHIAPDSWLFYVERPFVDGSRDTSEPPMWCLACPECEHYCFASEGDE